MQRPLSRMVISEAAGTEPVNRRFTEQALLHPQELGSLGAPPNRRTVKTTALEASFAENGRFRSQIQSACLHDAISVTPQRCNMRMSQRACLRLMGFRRSTERRNYSRREMPPSPFTRRSAERRSYSDVQQECVTLTPRVPAAGCTGAAPAQREASKGQTRCDGQRQGNRDDRRQLIAGAGGRARGGPRCG